MQRLQTYIYTHQQCLLHDTGAEHPEKPARLRAILDELNKCHFNNVSWQSAPEAELIDIAHVHDKDYILRLQRSMPKRGIWNINEDTIVSAKSFSAAKHAAGAVCAAVDAVCQGRAANAFCAVRPPGHHAERQHALGFCLINNIAVGTRRIQNLFDHQKVAIIDFDAHHGNGAQNIFWDDPSVLVVSIHRWPTDLITGDVDECGVHNQILNIPLPPAANGACLRRAVTQKLLPRIYDFNPDFLMVAAGFDGHISDPLTDLAFETEDFAWLGRTLLEIARICCDNRLVASLEGGYDIDALKASASAFVRTMQDRVIFAQ